MSSRRLFSRMAQIAILIALIVLAFFLIRGFARGDLHEEKRAYGSEGGNFPVIIEKWKEIFVSLTHTENIGNENHNLAKEINMRYNACAFCLNLYLLFKERGMCGWNDQRLSRFLMKQTNMRVETYYSKINAGKLISEEERNFLS
jgi:hypothetical protein